MNKFDEILKAKLEKHEAPLDMEMWNSIERELATPAASPSSSFGVSLMGGIAATSALVLLFISLPNIDHTEKGVVGHLHKTESEKVITEPKAEPISASFQEQESHDIELINVEVALNESSVERVVAQLDNQSQAPSENEVEEFIEEDITEVSADFTASGIQCPGSEISFNAVKAEGPVTWLFDGIHVKEGESVTHVFSPSGHHEVIMMIEINAKLIQVKKSIEIFEAPNFTVFSTIQKNSDCLTSEALLAADPTSYVYEWGLDGQRREGEETSYDLLPGTYMVGVKAISSDGCVGIVNHTLLVEDESGIYIENAFTPNDDGLNDTWAPQGITADNLYELTIFNIPAQEVVYHSSEIIEWDGSFNGQKLPIGKNYLYQLKITDSCGNSEIKSGTITTVR